MSSIVAAPDAAHGGEGWSPRLPSMANELGSLWGDCGSSSECGRLRRVALYRPGTELQSVESPAQAHWNELVELGKAREQFDHLVGVYEQNGVAVEIIEPRSVPGPNMMFVRDLFTMTPSGAILARLASPVRAGEEVLAAEFLAAKHIPILLSVTGTGVFEGPDLLFYAARRAFVGVGVRTNREGAEQVSTILRMLGIEVTIVETTYGCGHLDGVLSIVDRNKAIVFPKRLSYEAYRILGASGYEIHALADLSEAETCMAINMVALEPGRVLIPAGCPNTRKQLASIGVESIAVDLSEIMKGGGAMHCMTGILRRDPLD